MALSFHWTLSCQFKKYLTVNRKNDYICSINFVIHFILCAISSIISHHMFPKMWIPNLVFFILYSKMIVKQISRVRKKSWDAQKVLENKILSFSSSFNQTFWKVHHQIFVFWVRDFKFWLHAYFFIFFECAKFQQD